MTDEIEALPDAPMLPLPSPAPALSGDQNALEARLIATENDSPEHLAVLNALAWSLRQKNFARAQTLVDQAVELAQQIDDPAQLAQALRTRGWMRLVRAELEDAESDTLEALNLSRRLQNRPIEAACVLILSNLRRKQTDYAAAMDLLLRARDLYKDAGDPAGLSYALNNLGALCLELGSYVDGMEFLREGIDAAREAGDASAEMFCLANIADLKRETGNPEEAADDLLACLQIAETTGNRFARPYLLQKLCRTYLVLGQVEDALRVNEQALGETGDNHQVELDLLVCLGAICDELGMPDAARAAFSRALELCERIGDQERRLEALLQFGEHYQRHDALDDARACFDMVRELAENIGARRALGRAHAALSELYREQDSFAQALFHFQRFHEIDAELRVQTAQNAILAQVARFRREAEQERRQSVGMARALDSLESAVRSQSQQIRQLHAQVDAAGRAPMDDDETGLYNASFLLEILAREIARCRRAKTPLSLALIEIDFDTPAHEIAEVRRAFAGLMRRGTRGGDAVAYLGDNRYAAVLPQTDLAEAERVVSRIRAAAQLYEWDWIAPDLSVTLTIGLTDAPLPTAEALLAEADKALLETPL